MLIINISYMNLTDRYITNGVDKIIYRVIRWRNRYEKYVHVVETMRGVSMDQTQVTYVDDERRSH